MLRRLTAPTRISPRPLWTLFTLGLPDVFAWAHGFGLKAWSRWIFIGESWLYQPHKLVARTRVTVITMLHQMLIDRSFMSPAIVRKALLTQNKNIATQCWSNKSKSCSWNQPYDYFGLSIKIEAFRCLQKAGSGDTDHCCVSKLQ